ncbi:MAG: hypothetical protein J7K00_04890 [Candidatus Diapherotrites archaeon]|nr:hypothetical protein [Candidatus Diapherotrites archaeon]
MGDQIIDIALYWLGSAANVASSSLVFSLISFPFVVISYFFHAYIKDRFEFPWILNLFIATLFGSVLAVIALMLMPLLVAGLLLMVWT